MNTQLYHLVSSITSPIRYSIPTSISPVDIILSSQDTSESNCVEHVFLEVFVGANAPELARVGRVGHCHCGSLSLCPRGVECELTLWSESIHEQGGR